MIRLFCVFQILVLFILAATTAQGAEVGKYPKQGDPFPDLVLTGEISPDNREYLGLSGTGAQALGDIDAEAVLIEVFSMYCPFCQREAPKVNELFVMIKPQERLCTNVKMLGIGVGNSQFEVDFFQEKYSVPFPLFTDPDFTVMDRVGQIGTPFFALVRIDEKGRHETVLSHMGPFEDPGDFFEQVRTALCGESDSEEENQ